MDINNQEKKSLDGTVFFICRSPTTNFRFAAYYFLFVSFGLRTYPNFEFIFESELQSFHDLINKTLNTYLSNISPHRIEPDTLTFGSIPAKTRWPLFSDTQVLNFTFLVRAEMLDQIHASTKDMLKSNEALRDCREYVTKK